MRRRVMLVTVALVVLASGVLRAQLEFRPAAAAAVAGWQKMDLPDGGGSVWVAPTVSLTSADVARAQPVSEGGRPAVAIALTDAGAEKMRELSAAQVGQPIAMVLDGKLISAPIVRGTTGKDIVITGRGDGLTPDEVRHLVGSVTAR